MSEIINETINELNKPTQNNVFSIEDDPVTVLEKINQVERYLKQIDTRVDTSINTANEALEKANNAFEANGTLVKINGENQLTWSADFAESEKQKSETDGAIVHVNDIANKETTENKTDSLLTINNTLYPSMTALSEANKGNIRYGFSGQSEDDLLNWVKNDAPAGYYHFYWSHGQANGVDVMKASSEYAQVKLTFYFDPSMKINILTAGVWSGWKTVSTT